MVHDADARVCARELVGNEDGDFSSVGNEASTSTAGKRVAEEESPVRVDQNGDTAGGKIGNGRPAVAKKSTAKTKAAPPAATGPNPVIVKLNAIAAADADKASKVAELIRKAYKLKSVADATEAQYTEILARIDQYLSKTAAPAAGAPATASDIPE